jgi:energy-coupling factor transport system ATP-binding protein
MSICLEHVSFIYGEGTSTETKALEDINLEIAKGEFVAVIGHTGSGKSTLIQHFNGLEKPPSGTALMDGKNIWSKGYDLRNHRCKVGMVFQYPEHQLFEETVLKDVCFGPLNQKLDAETAEKKAKEALQLVGGKEDVYEASPFELSGGQKRRVAIAGILAMEPEYLVLDEPTAGLDPKGKMQILKKIKQLHDEKGMGIILVSHCMEDVAQYADRIVVLDHGSIVYDDKPAEVFRHCEELEKIGLSAPTVSYLMHRLKEKGFAVDEGIIRLEDAEENILKCLKGTELGN